MHPAWRIAADVAAGRVSPADVLAEHAARHAATHARLNALVQPQTAAAAAAALVATGGPLAGVPVSVKDCFAVAGLRTTLGLESRRNAVDVADGPLVAALRAAGAVIVGKANVPQAMMLHETDNRVWGRTCHPLDAARSPGGSSGGDAALVAAGVVPLAVGNDLAGSLRQPAHSCGIATLMPTSAVLGEGGACDIVPHLTAFRPRAGFLAADVADLDLALRAVAPSGAEPVPVRPVASLRVGWWDSSGPIPPSPAIARGVRRPLAAVARLAGSGLEARALVTTGPRTAAALAGLLEARADLARRFAALVADCDVVVCPVSAVPALRHGTAARLVLAAAPCLLANLLDLPAGAVPVTSVRADEETARGRSRDPVLRAAAECDRGSRGLPVGVQVIGCPGRDEATVLAAMAAIAAV